MSIAVKNKPKSSFSINLAAIDLKIKFSTMPMLVKRRLFAIIIFILKCSKVARGSDSFRECSRFYCDGVT
jgi:hypothetical protein